VVVVSPRSYFVFTPLLASTAVGTLEFRTALEPVRSRRSTVELYQGWAEKVDFGTKTLTIEENLLGAHPSKNSPNVTSSLSEAQIRDYNRSANVPRGRMFDVKYDKLVIAVGCYSQTFGTKGVKENALFLKDIADARKIRKRVLECFEQASLPTVSSEKKKELLNFAIVGGGPTGIEFSAELHDLIHDDLSRMYPTLIPHCKITIYDVAPTILSMFDATLSKYAENHFLRRGIQIQTDHHVTEVRRAAGSDGALVLNTKEDGDVGIGMCVWNTGLAMNPFVKEGLKARIDYPKNSAKMIGPGKLKDAEFIPWRAKKDEKTGGMKTDNNLRVKLIGSTSSLSDGQIPKEAYMKDVFALGDCAVIEGMPLPATAQVANQKALWLGKRMNKDDLDDQAEGFTFKNMGVMAYIGDWNAILQSGGDSEIKGRTAWFLWRAAYLTMSVSWRNKILIPTYW
jgi:NADH dehydrogenase FAD-containing subunit